MANFTEHDEDQTRLRLILERMNIDGIARCMQSSTPGLRSPAVKVIGNVCAGPSDYVDAIISCGSLKTFLIIIKTEHNSMEVVKEVCWAISNITVGTCKQIGEVVGAGLISALSDLILSNPNYCVSSQFRNRER